MCGRGRARTKGIPCNNTMPYKQVSMVMTTTQRIPYPPQLHDITCKTSVRDSCKETRVSRSILT